MDFEHFTAGTDDQDRRLDRIARKILPQENLSQLYRAIRSGLIKVDGKKQKGEYRVQSGQDISIAAFLIKPASDDCKNDEEKSPLNQDLIVFRNKHLIFINKPYNMSVQKADKNDVSLNEIVQKDFEINSKDNKSLSFKTGPLHRLDRLTTGLIAFSQSLEGARWFSKAIQEHTAEKTYLALVQGNLKTEEHWNDLIVKNDLKNKTEFHTVTVNSTEKDGKQSLTDAVPVAWGNLNGTPVTLVKFIIHTGRTHQIRAGASFHGFPLIGDTAYGGKKINGKQAFFLHAYSLTLPQNSLELPCKLICPITESFQNILKASLINWDGKL